MNHSNNQKFRKKRQLLLMIPILTVPFLTLTFWALGGGKNPRDFLNDSAQKGFNLELPGIAEEGKKFLDKMGHYQRSHADSTRYLQEVKKDPYYRMAFNAETEVGSNPSLQSTGIPRSPNQHTSDKLYSDAQEELILERLEALKSTLSERPEPVTASATHPNEVSSTSIPSNSGLDGDLDRLDQMMQQMQNSHAEPDPEFEQMAELLDKILDIQHPDRVQQRLDAERKALNENHHPVISTVSIPQSTSLDNSLPDIKNESPAQNGFFGLESDATKPSVSQSIQAVIHEEQTLVSGETVKLRLTQETNIAGTLLPKDQLVYGIASLNGDRLKISIRHIRIADNIIPVDLRIHDADGMEGIRIPGSIPQEVSKQSGSQTLQGLGFSSFDNSLEAQATSAGIETAKSFLGKKIRQVRVNLKAGYQVWIIENR
ncbi:Bacteroides conjugative transposon TraM protein [Algoriphagus locisalis]|uniref:Bacteroides conjugative transposon TraM protein n=1 Tax=Algoriphagus locisalis TaxID=305507 RepID=A0A1I7CD44_9BACT|nr:conjugative transposon protein TraM [Algoriphagus locisalis]SFT97345.1 Bacteroides conjugative transposon TraM protein [Algoriphagus locisalis]